MSKTISIHSFRGGTGKSNIAANVAVLWAAEGRRVGVVDADIQSPGIHVLFGLDEGQISLSLNDYLWGRCEIRQTAYDMTPRLGSDVKGRIFLIPSSMKTAEITEVLREGYDMDLLHDGFSKVVTDLDLDVLLIDTHPGINEETLFSIAISNALAIILRPDQQDYQGTVVTVDVARDLSVPDLVLLVNKMPEGFDQDALKAKVEQTYHCEVAAVLPHSYEMMALGSGGIFALRYPDHPVTATLKQVAARLVAG